MTKHLSVKYIHKFFVASLIVVILSGCNAEEATYSNLPVNENDTGYIENFSRACFFASSQEEMDSIYAQKKIRVELPSVRELSEINQILDYIGLPQNFSVYKGDVKNAMSTVINGKRFIVYSKNLLSRVDRTSGTLYWSSMFILAHEIGHHLSNHFTSHDIAPFDVELQADRFAGSVLCRLGATIEEATSTMSLGFVSGPNKTGTHPSPETRIAAIKEGWNKTMSQMDYSSAIPPPPSTNDIEEEYGSYALGMDSLFIPPDNRELELSDKDTVALIFEGIITKIIEDESIKDTDEDIPAITQIQVHITKDLSYVSKDDSLAKLGGYRLLFEVPYGDFLCHLCQRGYLETYERGKKIRVKAFVYGTGQHLYIYHIEFLKRE